MSKLCGFCGFHKTKSVTLVKGKEINICKGCNKRWQLSTKENN